jgi:hypothetical protein
MLGAVHLLFLDESGTPDARVFAVGGFTVRADEWQVLRDRWHAALERHKWPIEQEIKWHGVRTGGVPPALGDELLEAIAGAPITCFVIVLRPREGKVQSPELFATEDDIYATALMFIAERYQRFLSREDSYGVVVLDSRRREMDDRLRRFFERLQQEGTPYLKLGRVVDSLLLGPSHYSIGLQTADLIVATALGARAGGGEASGWHRRLRGRFAVHPDTGSIDGVGMKVYPPDDGAEEPAPGKLFAG